MNVTDESLDDRIFDRDVERLVSKLGSRPVAEILREVGCRYLVRTMIHSRVKEYLGRLTPEMLAATGGDHLVRFRPFIIADNDEDGGAP
jgi:hypothetical protein